MAPQALSARASCVGAHGPGLHGSEAFRVGDHRVRTKRSVDGDSISILWHFIAFMAFYGIFEPFYSIVLHFMGFLSNFIAFYCISWHFNLWDFMEF